MPAPSLPSRHSSQRSGHVHCPLQQHAATLRKKSCQHPDSNPRTSSPGSRPARRRAAPPRAAPGSASGTRATAPCGPRTRREGSAGRVKPGVRIGHGIEWVRRWQRQGLGVHSRHAAGGVAAGTENKWHCNAQHAGDSAAHLGGEEHEVRVRAHHLVQLRHKQLTVVVQQPVSEGESDQGTVMMKECEGSWIIDQGGSLD